MPYIDVVFTRYWANMADIGHATRIESLAERFRREQALVAGVDGDSWPGAKATATGAPEIENDIRIVHVTANPFESAFDATVRTIYTTLDWTLFFVMLAAFGTAAYMLWRRYTLDTIVTTDAPVSIERRALRREIKKQKKAQ